MLPQLDKITLPPKPQPASTLPEYQRNVENWAREVERTFRQLETAVRALIDAANQGSGGVSGAVSAAAPSPSSIVRITTVDVTKSPLLIWLAGTNSSVRVKDANFQLWNRTANKFQSVTLIGPDTAPQISFGPGEL